MEIIAVVLIVLLLVVLPATLTSILGDGRGHTPREESHPDWKAMDLPSTNYTLRNF
ncbi:hypothetical protein [Arthrobacter sp. R4-81]